MHLHKTGTDLTPSFTVNLDTGVYWCNACASKGNALTFYAHINNLDKEEAWYVLGDSLGITRPTDVDSRPGINPALPGSYHRALMSSTAVVRDILRDRRGLTDASLEKFTIGWDGERVTIPVYDEFLELVNIRRYQWNSKDDSCKMTNYVDEANNAYGEARIYGIEHLYDRSVESVVWCEGEWDRIIAEQNGIKACTASAGANAFNPRWYKILAKKKRIYVCYDNDDAGKKATDEFITGMRGRTELYIMQWPKETDGQKYDISDAFVKGKMTAEHFMSLFKPLNDYEKVPTVDLAFSSNAKFTGKRIRVPVLVAGKESSPYIFPKNVTLSCSPEAEDKNCEGCPLNKGKRVVLNINNEKAEMLKLIDCRDDAQRTELKMMAKVNPKCKLPHVSINEYGNLETLTLIPKADTNFGFSLHKEYVARTGYVIGTDIPTNKRYNLIGYMHASPIDQKATYIFDEYIPEKDILDELVLTPELHKSLKVFQCAEGQSVASKFEEIHRDLERNVTYIWDRKYVAYAVDLTYHSALSFTFQEQPVKRGWCECLIIGDSGQAKTTLVERLMQHYKAGELLSGESSKRTGLVYSLQQVGKSSNWSLVWGAMPLNDGGLLTIDELSGIPEDDLAKMSDVRSSGIAKSTGVISAETTARTRIIFISNPRSGRQLKTENYGVSSVLKLFGKTEDVRRLDFALAVASGEVDANIVNKSVSEMPTVEHRYTTDLCKLRVQWAWSRRPHNIYFTPEAVKAILECSMRMGKKYSSRIPLVEPADQRLKVARLAVSAAICTYSTEDGENVIVTPAHVDFIDEYLNSIYDTRALGYDRFSADEFENSDTTDEAIQRLRTDFLALAIVTREPIEIVRAVYQMPYFNRNTIEDATGLERDEIKALLHFLIANTLVEKAGVDYKRTTAGLAFIENLLTYQPTKEEVARARQQKYSKEKSEV